MHALLLFLLASLTAAATTHEIAAGLHGLTYTPNTTFASIGDTVTFTFYPYSHNVVQGPFSAPCTSGNNTGIYSSFIPSSSGPSNLTFSITIEDTNPIWFYCSQKAGGGHCTKGMVGVINPPPEGTNITLENYALGAAKVANGSYTQPGDVQGGVLGWSNGTAAGVGNGSVTSTSSEGGASSTSVSVSGTSTSVAATATKTGGAGRVDAAGWVVVGGLGIVLL